VSISQRTRKPNTKRKNSFSGFVEAPPFFEAKLQRTPANLIPASWGLRRQGQCKPNAIELARIAEVQPVLADFIGKIRHNILKEDGFENADPEISRVIPSYPELSRDIPRRAKKKHQNFCVLMLLLLSSLVYLI